jgi:hypothetical protein
MDLKLGLCQNERRTNNVRVIKLAGHAAHMGEIKVCTKSEELTERELFDVRA